MSKNNSHELDRLFFPKSIAVVGASPRANATFGGNGPILGSIKQNFQGNIYPVHPKAKSILGYKAYRSVRDIPDDIDLVIFTVPVSAVLDVMEDCVAKGVRFVHIYTAGFSEIGHEAGVEIERKMIDMIRNNGPRVIGPNCMGIYNPEGGLAWGEIFPTTSGPISIFSQSGQLANAFIAGGETLGLHFSKVISYGNASDLQANDFLDYFGQDNKTEIIGAYMEGLKEGRDFFKKVGVITRKKPIVIFKGGISKGGSRATLSHTSAIAGAPEIWRALCRQTGVISVRSKEELMYTLQALNRLPLPLGRSVAIFGGAGGGSVTMADTAEREGLEVPLLSKESIRKLEESMPREGHSVKNPIDLIPALFNGDLLIEIFSLIDREPNIDALIMYIFTPGPVTGNLMSMGSKGVEMFCRNTVDAGKKLKKPMVIALERDMDALRGQITVQLEERYREAGFAVFPSFELAARVLCNLYEYQAYLSKQGGVPS